MHCAYIVYSDEHQRRSPDCIFFTFSAAKPKTGRSKKSRNSSASRLSTQSNLTALDEGASIVGIPGANEDETMGVAVEPAKVAKADRGSKKVQKSKKAFGKLKAKGAKENLEETQTTSSFLEPEDDDFEVKVVPAPSSGADTKKRKSEEIETYIEEIPEPVVKDNAVEPRPLAKKRRVTRARSSVAQSQDASMLNFQEEIGLDAGMADTVEISPANDPAPKKKGKSSKKRATSIARKVSSASKASKASLRAAVPSNQDIEAALEADLDRPLTDNEDDAQDLEFKQPKHRRLTRTKPAIKKGTASIASTRRGTRASTATVDHVPEEAQYPSIPHSPESEFGKIDVCAEAPVEGLSKGNKANGKASRKVSKPQPHYESQTEDIEGTNALLVKPLNEEVMESKKPSLPKSRQVSRHLPTRRTRASNMPETQDVVDEAFDMNSSVLTTEMAQDDSSHETNTNAIKVGRAKRVNRQAPNAIKKARTGKKLNTASRNDDDIVRATAAKEDAVEIAWQANEDVSKKIDSLEYDSIVQEVQIEQEDVRQDTLKGTPKTSAPIAKPRKKKAQEQLSPATSNKSTETGDSPIIPLPSHMQRTLQPVLSPQSSDAENQPPSSRPSALRPPLSIRSSLNPNIIRVPLSVTTPSTSPSRGNTSKLQSTLPWTAVDLEQVFRGSPLPNKENNPLVFGKTSGTSGNILTSPEKMLTVEQWIQLNAERGEEKLRNECERLVGIFESQGMRALKTLEGIVASD